MASSLTINDFNILKTLGSGTFSSVYKVERKQDKQIYALKKVKLSQLTSKEKDNALNEVRILASINSPHIIRYKDAFYDESSGSLCIIMEFAENGDLHSQLKALKKKGAFIEEYRIWRYAGEILAGLKTLHELKILHRDLKSANIFLGAHDKVKLGDLNVSKIAKRDLAYTQTGTPYYTSPEVWQNQPYDAKCDVWSMGCVLYEMMAQNPPFQATSMDDLYRRVCKGSYPKLPKQYSAEMNDFIGLCLRKSAKARPTAQQLLECKELINQKEKLYPTRLPTEDDKENKQPNSPGLLQTIKMPFGNLSTLRNILPKSQFEDSIDYFIEEQLSSKRGISQRPISSAHNNKQISGHRNSIGPIGSGRECAQLTPTNVSQNQAPLSASRQRIYSANHGNVLKREDSSISVQQKNNDYCIQKGVNLPPKGTNSQHNISNNNICPLPKSPEIPKKISALQRNAIELVKARNQMEEGSPLNRNGRVLSSQRRQAGYV